MVVSFCILGVYNMANGLEHISEILKRLTDELKQDNDNWERKYGQSNVLPTSDAGTRTTRGSDHDCCGQCKKPSNSTTGE